MKGFSKTPTQWFTVEILRRDLNTGDEVAIEEYRLEVERPPGRQGWDTCIKTAVELAHIRIYDLLNAYCKSIGEDDPPVAYDAFIWRNRTEGEPIYRISTTPFDGSVTIPVISAPDTPVDKIRAEKELGRVISKIN